MKRISPIYVILGCILTLLGGVSFVDAQVVQLQKNNDCQEGHPICGAPSPEFALMLDFVREMMFSIKTIGPEGPYLGDYVNPNWFEGNVFSPPEKTLAGRVLRNINQKATFAIATTVVFASPVTILGAKDFLGNIVLVSKNRVFLRDNKLVEELESQLSTKKLEVGLGGGRFVPINDANRVVMQNIIQTYIDAGLLHPDADKTYIREGVRYENVLSLLTAILSSMKTFLYLDTIGQFNDISRGGYNGIRITFVPDIGGKIKSDYDCARGLRDVCNTTKKSFRTVWSDMSASFSQGRGEVKTTVVDANRRLGYLFSSKDITKKDSSSEDRSKDASYQARKHDLLQSAYGTSSRDRFFVTNTGDVGISDLFSFWNFKKNTNFSSTIKHSAELLDSSSLDAVVSVSTYDRGEATLENILRGYISDVIQQQALDKEFVVFDQVTHVTPGFMYLGKQIAAIRNHVLGSKHQDGTLIKALGNACELQCGRGGLCRR